MCRWSRGMCGGTTRAWTVLLGPGVLLGRWKDTMHPRALLVRVAKSQTSLSYRASVAENRVEHCCLHCFLYWGGMGNPPRQKPILMLLSVSCSAVTLEAAWCRESDWAASLHSKLCSLALSETLVMPLPLL